MGEEGGECKRGTLLSETPRPALSYLFRKRIYESGVWYRLCGGGRACRSLAKIRGKSHFTIAGHADRKSTRLNSSHICASRMQSSACKQKPILTTYLTKIVYH